MTPSGIALSCLTLISIEPLLVVTLILSPALILFLSISFTTRPPRPLEVNESDYFFVNDEKFIDMLNKDEFLEHAKVFDFYYGTPKKPVMNALKSGKDILFDIDWQGTQQLMNSVQDDLVKIFVLPPSAKELEKRLLKRNQDTDETVKNRMSKASDEISHYAEYDYIIINHDIKKSAKEVKTILDSERKNLVDYIK